MLKIGITGGVACGKTEVTKTLEKMGFPVIDTDILAKNIREEPSVKAEIQRLFSVTSAQDLRNLVFTSPEAKMNLEKLLHPKIRQKVNEEVQKLEKQGAKATFVVIPLLFEAKLEATVDKIVTIYSSSEQQMQRLSERPGISPEMARSIIASQLDTREKAARSDYVIKNSGTLEDLQQELQNFLKVLIPSQTKCY